MDTPDSESWSLERLRHRSRWPLVFICGLAGLWMLHLAALHSLLSAQAPSPDPGQHQLWLLFSLLVALLMFAGATAAFLLLRPKSHQ